MKHANQWRVSSDFRDRWKDLANQFDLLDQSSKYAGPGHFPDADMIPFGHLGTHYTIAGKDPQTRFVPAAPDARLVVAQSYNPTVAKALEHP